MPPIKLNPDQLKKALDRQRRGWTHQRIAKALRVSCSTVAKSLDHANRQVNARLIDQAAAAKGRQLQVLHRIVEEALGAWERSKRPSRVRKAKTKPGDAAPEASEVEAPPAKGKSRGRGRTRPAAGAGGAVVEVTREARSRDGDPRYLVEARAALADERKLLGIEKTHAERSFDLSRATAEAEEEARKAIADENRPSLRTG